MLAGRRTHVRKCCGPGVCRCLTFLALVFPAAAIVGKRGLRIYPENAAQAEIPLSEGTPKAEGLGYANQVINIISQLDFLSAQLLPITYR